MRRGSGRGWRLGVLRSCPPSPLPRRVRTVCWSWRKMAAARALTPLLAPTPAPSTRRGGGGWGGKRGGGAARAGAAPNPGSPRQLRKGYRLAPPAGLPARARSRPAVPSLPRAPRGAPPPPAEAGARGARARVDCALPRGEAAAAGRAEAGVGGALPASSAPPLHLCGNRSERRKKIK